MRIKNVMMIVFLAVFCLAGCGYTTRSLLPAEYKTIFVNSIVNKIKITAEQSNVRMYRGYRPGIELEITRAIIDRFLFDGNLKIADNCNANLILAGDLVDFRKEPLRYDANDNIEEWRIIVTINAQVKDPVSGKVLWKEDAFSGMANYRITGGVAQNESQAVAEAVEDLARRVVEKTIEGW
jgi:hypothetical protein